MYSIRPNLMLGFHGCDESVRNEFIQPQIQLRIVKKNLIGWVMDFICGKITMKGHYNGLRIK